MYINKTCVDFFMLCGRGNKKYGMKMFLIRKNVVEVSQLAEPYLRDFIVPPFSNKNFASPGNTNAWERHHPIKWEDTAVLTQARGYKELRRKEAFHIRRIPAGNRLNHDLELELPNCWEATLRRLQNKRKQQRTRPSLIRSRRH